MRDKLIEICLDFVEPTPSTEELNKYTNEHLLKLIEEVWINKGLMLPFKLTVIAKIIKNRFRGLSFLKSIKDRYY